MSSSSVSSDSEFTAESSGSESISNHQEIVTVDLTAVRQGVFFIVSYSFLSIEMFGYSGFFYLEVLYVEV